jgi:hypothetical protein
MKNILLLISIAFLAFSCNENKPIKPTTTDVEYLHQAQKKLTDLIITDIFTPPVASRVYVYPLLAAYEAGKFSEKDAASITAQLKGFGAMPMPENGKNYNFTIAAIKALCTTSKKVIFSTKEIDAFEEKTLGELKIGLAEDVFNNSVSFGDSVANTVIKRLNSDNYKETRGMERFEVKANNTGRWVPTLPDYADAVEPHWAKMKTFLLDTAAQFRPIAPPQYSEVKSSPFWKELTEVYDISKTVVEERENIMVFWDDNPFVSRTKGHLMFQDKKMTPGGHWLAICQSFLKDKKVGFYASLRAYTMTSLAIYEGFLSCWEAKYYYASVRPETVISDKIDKQWHPLLVTPPFPSYTSGHSTVSAAAAETLTALFGDNQAYTDETEKEYGLPVRSFKSFREAAKEASISRVYAGIHFRSDCEKGNEQGVKVGKFVVSKVK